MIASLRRAHTMLDNKGFTIFAQENTKVDYVRQSYALALSIKNFMPQSKVCLITNVDVPNNMKHIFDHVIDIPGSDLALKSEWKIENRCKIYDITPFKSSIILDADMLVCSDISHWWDMLENFNLFFVNHVLTYRSEVVNDKYYRKTFIKNRLPNLYCGMHFYKHVAENKKFVDLLKFIVTNYEAIKNNLLLPGSQSWCSMDVSVALVSKMLGISEKITSKVPYLTFTHLKPHIQNWNNVPTHCAEKINLNHDAQCRIKVDHFMQQGILHYVEPEFLTNDLLKNLEKRYHAQH